MFSPLTEVDYVFSRTTLYIGVHVKGALYT